MPASETAALLRRPGFTRYFTIVAVSRASAAMFNVAGVLLILERTHDLALAGLVVAAASLPAAVTGPFLGGWLDVTTSRRRLLVLDRLLTAVSLAALLLLAGHSPNWLLPVVALLYGVTAPLSAGAFSALLPEVAGADLLGIANAFEGASYNAAFIVGPALAGVIAAAASAAAAVEVQLAATLVLAILIARDATFELRPEHGESAPANVLHAVREGLRAIWRIAPLRWNTSTDFLYVVAWGTLNVSFPAYAVEIGAGAQSSGYMWAAIAAGSLVGGFALRGRSGARSSARLIGVYLLAMAASSAVWPLAGALALALALVFLTGLLDGPPLIALITVSQRLSPAHLRAQILTTSASLASAATAAGAAGAGVFHRLLGTNPTLLLFPGTLAVAGALSLMTKTAGERAGPG
jgi:Major Facilitator Superfamily